MADIRNEAEQSPDYTTWSNASLVERITELERQLKSQTTKYNAPATETSPAPVTRDEHEPAIPLKAGIAESAPQKKPAQAAEDIVHAPGKNKALKESRDFDPSKYSTRFIALKFAYLGQRYNGLEHTNGNITPLPTIEEMLWKALRRTRLIFPETSSPEDEPDDVAPRAQRPYSLFWDGCDYSKAGRTDRGVSAFGQVVGIRVRSARPKPKMKPVPTESDELQEEGMQIEEEAVDQDWDDIADEISYIQVLNRVLPEDIRILAWCPNPPPDFNARFSCRERQYRYFFTQPAFSPTPGGFGFENRADRGNGPRAKYREGWLDIEAMREAAKYYEGVHDFRNFCKLDTSKQIENFEREIYKSDIEYVDPKSNPLGYVRQPGFQAQENTEVTAESTETASAALPQVYTFTLHGSAFLWHQVRHMVALLFLVGQGLESPTIVRDLLDVTKNPCKPTYEMASDAPLVLWDTIFPDENSGSREDAMNWVYAGDSRLNANRSAKGDSKFGLKGVVDGLWSVWRQRKIDEILAGALLDLTVSQGDNSIMHTMEGKQGTRKTSSRGAKVWLGDNDARVGGKYVPVSQKGKTDAVEVQNARWRASKQRKLDAQQDAGAKAEEK